MYIAYILELSNRDMLGFNTTLNIKTRPLPPISQSLCLLPPPLVRNRYIFPGYFSRPIFYTFSIFHYALLYYLMRNYTAHSQISETFYLM